MTTAIIIGGGFYGTSIAIYLAQKKIFKHIIIIEQEDDIHKRASYNNQARVHNGYHYPRNFSTAFRSRVNLPKFLHDYPNAVETNFTKLYAIARKNSKTTSKQFENFCQNIKAYIAPASNEVYQLFNKNLIEKIYFTQEYCFNIEKITEWTKVKIQDHQIKVHCRQKVIDIDYINTKIILKTTSSDQADSLFSADYIFNCTYSGLNNVAPYKVNISKGIKHEITEMLLLEMPETLKNYGITVMDGAFFSLMPFPAKRLHTLSHVRYTPHFSWHDSPEMNPYLFFDQYNTFSRKDWIIRDTARYLPEIEKSNYIESLLEIKTLLQKNETDDGRPILFEKHPSIPNFYSILGGKIDNIYDILEKINQLFGI